jgi:hypothetical protein
MSLVPYTSLRRAATPRRSSATKSHSIYAFQAPLKGLDISQPLPGGDPLTAVRLENLIPRVFGVQLRKGYKRWCTMPGGEIRKLMDYSSPDGDVQKFAASSDGDVYEVTAALPSSTVPPIAFTAIGPYRNGEYSYTNFTTSTGVHYLVAVCAGSGMWVYDGTTWTQIVAGTAPLQIDGVDPIDFDFVMIWKSRLWFIEKDTTVAWYLPVGQVAGTAKAFNFGSLLPHGGSLAMLTNWTMDGGQGMDDNLVAIASEGDVIIYQGIDPDTAATFNMVGRWYLGRVPVGRRFATQYSSDIAIVSERGLCFLSELMRGQAFFANAIIAQNVNAQLATEVAETLDQHYWEVAFLPHEQLIVINRPATATAEVQYAYEVNNKAFCNLTGLPMLTVENLDGRSYFGDNEGNMWWVFEGNADGSVDDVIGKDLEGILLTTFQPMGEGVRLKRFLMLRPSFTSRSPPAVNAKLNNDWTFSMPPGAPPYTTSGESLWDSGRWNTAVWSGETNSYEAWIGCVGTGRFAAMALQVRGEADTTLIGWSALVEAGGIL